MRSAFAFCISLGLSLAVSATAIAARVHHPRTRQHMILGPSQYPVVPVVPPGWYKFPGYPPIPPSENRNLDPSNRGSA